MRCVKSGPTCWWIKKSSPLDDGTSNITFWWWCCCSCSNCCCWALIISFWRLSSSTLRCEFECLVSTNVGLAAGLYSGTSRPDLYLTPHALHSVFGPMGPVRHCGVLSVAQCRHFRPSPPSPLSLFLGAGFFGGATATATAVSEEWWGEGVVVVVVVVVGDRTRRREVQLHGGPRVRLLRAFAGTDTCGLNTPGPAGSSRVCDAASFCAFIPDISCSFCRSSLENDSSANFESHSSSARSSYCSPIYKLNQNTHIYIGIYLFIYLFIDIHIHVMYVIINFFFLLHYYLIMWALILFCSFIRLRQYRKLN